MNTEIYLNGTRLDTWSSTNIRFSFQVNDIADVKDRQASYTNQFTIPRTPSNVQAFDGLGLPSSGSRLPYTRPNSQLKLEGFDLINKGWLNVQETSDDSYSVYMYSGVINFFKAIENKTFADLILDELNHNKTVMNVAASMNDPEAKPYRYLVADYNGNTMRDTGELNVDYLVPAVSMRYLWDKIHARYNVPFSGTFYNTPEFNDLFMTYPKAINPADRLKEAFRGTVKERLGWSPLAPMAMQDSVFSFDPYTVKEGALLGYGLTLSNVPEIGNQYKGHYRFPRTGEYKVRVKGKVNHKSKHSFAQIPEGSIVVWYAMNQVDKRPNEMWGVVNRIAWNGQGESFFEFNFERQVAVNENETITFGISDRWGSIEGLEGITVEIDEITDDSIDFTSELRDISITDFIKDVLNRFAVTPFTNEYDNTVVYKTLAERVHNNKVVDWSDKFISRTKEKYIFSSYAQRNIFRYKYNDKEGNYNDGYMFINNVNLAQSKDVFSSMFYSPENGSSIFTFKSGTKIANNVFKMWDVETDKDGKVKYKPLDKRFYLVKASRLITPVTLVSDNDRNTANVAAINLGRFDGLNMFDVITANYTDFVNIAGDSKIQTIQLDLEVSDILNLDLDMLYYFEQEQQYYLLNKLDVEGNRASGDFVRVRPVIPEGENADKSMMVPEWDPDQDLSGSGRNTGRARAIIYGEPLSGIWQIRHDGGAWNSIGTVDGSNFFTINFTAGLNEIRIQYETLDGTKYSSIISYRRSNITTKCYYWVLENKGASKLFQIKYIDTNGNEKIHGVQVGTLMHTALEGKDLIDTDGLDLITQTEIQCP